ncbi:MAG: DNA primase small subunit domain-containing protein [Promethearchaeota archaeon]
MNENNYLKRLFQKYYNEKQDWIPKIDFFEKREFGFIPWDKEIMIRHVAFNNLEEFRNKLALDSPKHVYSSGTIYEEPDHLNMNEKGYLGCDLIIDIDVDHFYTPCKDEHDIWYCKECGKSGKGMHGKTCKKCGSNKFKTLAWICDDCLEIAKAAIKKLIENFLIPDFGIEESELNIAFSGHRGYHIKIENEKIRLLSSEGRREIADYLSGNNISFEVLGFRSLNNNIFGLRKQNIGWSQKIMEKVEEILHKSNLEIEHLLMKFNFNKNQIQSFNNSKEYFLKIISNENGPNVWAIEGFDITSWLNFLNGIVGEIGVEIDEPVTIDIHRLIRYPGTLHGKTGFKVQELKLEELDSFFPLDESNKNLDPIVFYSEKLNQKLEVVENAIPASKIKGETFGPYTQGEKIEVPNHIAILYLCKDLARLL